MGIFSYTPLGPGKGVNKNASELRSPFLFIALFTRNMWNFVKMNLLFLLTCIPVITIGPAICGLTYFSKCVTEETHMFLLSDYFEYFFKNFFKGLIAFIINSLPLLSLYIVYSNMNAIPHFNMFILPVLLVNLIVLIMSFYVYPMIITYKLPLWAIYKNAFIFTMINLFKNIFIAIVFILVIALAVAIHIALGNLLMPLIGYGMSVVVSSIAALFTLMSLLNFIATFFVLPTIKKYMEE